jgi:MFS-type transporter involved in bile tolerance (Atg22 family)
MIQNPYEYNPLDAKLLTYDVLTIDHTRTVQATFTMAQSGSQALYLIVVVALSVALGFNDVQTAQLGQGIDTLWSGWAFFLAWKTLKPAPTAHKLPEGKSVFSQSFPQVWQTVKKINAKYGQSLRWYFLAVVFAEAAVTAVALVSVVFLADQLRMSGTEIGVFFLITLVGSLPGSRIGAMITSRVNPSNSWRLSILYIMVVYILGAFILKEGLLIVAYAWGFVVGLGLGWYYPAEGLCFSMLLPKGQEAELSGFFVYCTQILGWLPPLIFSALVQSNVDQKYGILAVQAFFVVAIALISMIHWVDAVEQVHGREFITNNNGEETGGDVETVTPSLRPPACG